MKYHGFKNKLVSFSADALSLFHAILVLIVAFGWWMPTLYLVHFAFLVGTWLSWVSTGSCILAKWEYKIRKKVDDAIEDYEHGYLHYHLRKLTGLAPSLGFIRVVGIFYLSSGITLWIINHLVLPT